MQKRSKLKKINTINKMTIALIVMFAYFIPTIVGFSSHKKNSQAIFVLNLFLGWTIIGWIISLVWATTKD